jgi:hypothetical protein
VSRSLTSAVLTTPDRTLVSPHGHSVKAQLRDNTEPNPLSAVVLDSAKRAHGKQGAAAAVLGKDEGNFSRDTKAGRLSLRELHELGPEFLADLGKSLVEQYAPLATPKARALSITRAMRRELDELDQAIEGME